MQIKIAKVEAGKSGTGEHGEWTMRKLTFSEPVRFFEQDGAEHIFTRASTFDSMAAAIKPGDTIEAELSLSDDKKYLNLKKIQVAGAPQPDGTPVGQQKPAGVAPPPAKPAQSTDERIAEQVAFKAIIDLWVADKAKPEWIAAASAWIERHIAVSAPLPVNSAPSALLPNGINLDVVHGACRTLGWKHSDLAQYLNRPPYGMIVLKDVDKMVEALTPKRAETFKTALADLLKEHGEDLKTIKNASKQDSTDIPF